MFIDHCLCSSLKRMKSNCIFQIFKNIHYFLVTWFQQDRLVLLIHLQLTATLQMGIRASFPIHRRI